MCIPINSKFFVHNFDMYKAMAIVKSLSIMIDRWAHILTKVLINRFHLIDSCVWQNVVILQ